MIQYWYENRNIPFTNLPFGITEGDLGEEKIKVTLKKYNCKPIRLHRFKGKAREFPISEKEKLIKTFLKSRQRRTLA